MLEVGTAIGLISMVAASIAGPENVVTYEANPYVLMDAQRNFRHNGLPAIHAVNAVLQNKLAFDSSGQSVEFHISKDFWASRLDISSGSDDIIETVEVPVLCLEKEIEGHRANFLICDIEGGEVELLTAADLSSVRVVLLETHYWSTGKAGAAKLVRQLVAAGFDMDLDLSRHHVSVFTRELV